MTKVVTDRVWAKYVKIARLPRGRDHGPYINCSYWRIYKDGKVVDTRTKKVNAYKSVQRLRKELECTPT